MSRIERNRKICELRFFTILENKWFTRIFCKTPTCKYPQNSKNIKFNKILDLEREKAKKNLERAENVAKIAKVTRIFLAPLKSWARDPRDSE